MSATRIFLASVGALYVLLAGWCAWMPEATSRAVGFRLEPGSGQSEFLTVYGGLELALGIIFLWPLYRPDTAPLVLGACIVVHGCLVLFRTAGFVLFRDMPTTTWMLAATEWLILVVAAVIWWRVR